MAGVKRDWKDKINNWFYDTLGDILQHLKRLEERVNKLSTAS